LKTSLADVGIFGPTGDPNGKPKTTRYTLIPWEIISEEDKKESSHEKSSGGTEMPAGGWNLADRNAVFGELPVLVLGFASFEAKSRACRLTFSFFLLSSFF
jgi:hypothetical protein